MGCDEKQPIEQFDNQYSQQTETLAFDSVMARIPAHNLSTQFARSVNGLAFHQKGVGAPWSPHNKREVMSSIARNYLNQLNADYLLVPM